MSCIRGQLSFLFWWSLLGNYRRQDCLGVKKQKWLTFALLYIITPYMIRFIFIADSGQNKSIGDQQVHSRGSPTFGGDEGEPVQSRVKIQGSCRSGGCYGRSNVLHRPEAGAEMFDHLLTLSRISQELGWSSASGTAGSRSGLRAGHLQGNLHHPKPLNELHGLCLLAHHGRKWAGGFAGDLQAAAAYAPAGGYRLGLD